MHRGLARCWGHVQARRLHLSPGLTARLDSLLGRHGELEGVMQSSDALAALTPAELTRKSKELARLGHVAALGGRWRELAAEASDLKEVLDECDLGTEEGQEMQQLAKESLDGVEEEAEDLRASLLEALLPTDEADDRAAILELRAGTGGDEAALFTAQVLDMYQRYASRQGWATQLLDVSRTSNVADGVKDASLAVSGDSVFGRLKHESGVHRVQRVPATESSGRLHTSTMSVVVLPEAEEVDVDIKSSDLQIDTFRASGAGGQHVNTTDSAVRMTHVPTGITVSIQDERSQHSNKAKALKVLMARLFALRRQEVEASRSQARRSQIGSGDRSERIRTYNFPQDRITDHRVNLSVFGLSDMMAGSLLDTLIDALEDADKELRLKDMEDI